MVQFQLQFQNLTLEDIKDEQKRQGNASTDLLGLDEEDEKLVYIAMAFDKGQILHPSPKLMKGAILLPLPLGEFPKIAAFDNVKLDAVLKKVALEHFPLGETASDLFQLSKYPTSEIFLMAPTLKQWTKKTDLFLKGVFVFWTMDDFLSRSVASCTPFLSKDDFYDFEHFLINIMSGLYRIPDAIPNLEIPFLNVILQAWFSIYLDLKKHVAGYDTYHVDFLREILNWIRYYKLRFLHMGQNWEPTNQPYAVQKNLGGRKIILELIQLLNATYVDHEYREHILFTMFRDSADLICNLVYDIVTLNRLGQGRKMDRNSLHCNITKGGLTFEAALDQHLLVINNEILDLRKAAGAICVEKKFEGIENVQKYVRNTMLFVEGNIRYLLSQERYGKCELKIMKVVNMLHQRW